MAADGNRRARSALVSMSDLTRQLAGAQLGITMASLGLGFVAEPTIAHFLEDVFADLPSAARHAIATGIALLIVVLVHMVLGEMVPKNIAIAEAEGTLMVLAGPHRAFVLLFRPVIALLDGLSRVGVRMFGAEVVDELGTAHTAQEFGTLVDASRGEGLIDDFVHNLLSGALDMQGRTVQEVLVPRDQVVWAPRNTPADELIRLAEQSGHSRIPLSTGADGGMDPLTGFVHVKDLLVLPEEQLARPVPPDQVRRMLVVRADASLEGLLRAMRRARVHFAVIRADERTVGIATLEDLLEELVGDIIDESDRIRAVLH